MVVVLASANHPIQGMAFVMATTRYRLPDVIMDIAWMLMVGANIPTLPGGFQAEGMPVETCDITGWYAFDPHDPRMIGYDYCTPDYIMGSLLIDSHYREWSPGWVDLKEGYPALTYPNRYHAIVFPAISMPVWFPNAKAGNRKTYGEQQAVHIRMFY